MTRWAFAPLAALLAALFYVSVALAAQGDHISSADFNVVTVDQLKGLTWNGTSHVVLSSSNPPAVRVYTAGTGDSIHSLTGIGGVHGLTWDGTHYWVLQNYSGNSNDRIHKYTAAWVHTSFFYITVNAASITWDGAYLRLANYDTDTVNSFTQSGTHTSSADFSLASGNDDPRGITWDGTYFRVVDHTDDKVYTYTSSGTHTPTQDFALTENNGNPTGITWDGAYFRVVDDTDDKVYTYEGPTSTTTPTSTFGLSEDNRDYAASISTEVVVYGDWKCITSQTGETVRLNNAQLSIHGFCAKPDSGGSGMEVEIHLSSEAEYADLSRFADVTGAWWFIESGIPAQFDQRIYDDTVTTESNQPTPTPVPAGTPTPTPEPGTLAFTEQLGQLEASDRLTFATMVKAVVDADCTETSGAGFACSLSYLTSLSAGDDGVLLFSLTDENKVAFADTPTVPESLTVSRNSGYTVATVQWELYDAVTVYEIQRLTAVQVAVADATRIEYGDPVTYRVVGTQTGIDEYVDSTIEVHRTYQYRIRARGASSTSWSFWTENVFSGARPQVDLAAPGNLELTRGTGSVIASWSAPPGALDNYTLQRQEQLVSQGSTFFGNVITLGGGTWLSGASTMYTDSSIIPSQTYEYRVAAVKEDQVGVYSGWFRIGPPNTSLGPAPQNYRFLSTGRVLDARREFWMGWDEVGGADDYEVQLVVFDAAGAQSAEEYIVTAPTFFMTAYGRVLLRVRGRKLDTEICSASPDDRCLTQWTVWNGIRFTPTVKVEPPAAADDTQDASIMALRADMTDIIEAVLEPSGATVDADQVLEFMVLVVAVVIAGVSVALSWRRGMVPLGVGMGAAIFILILFVGYRLFGTPLAWPVAAQSLVAVAGIFALIRQTGVFR